MSRSIVRRNAANRSLVPPTRGGPGPAAPTGWCTSDRAARPVRLAAPGRRPGAAAGAGAGHGRRAAGRAAAGHGQAARPGAARPPPRPRLVRRAGSAGRLDGPGAAGPAGVPRRGRHGGGDRRHRRPPGRHLRLRLHGAGRLDGRHRRDQDGPRPRAGPAPTHPHRLAAGLGGRADPVVVRVDVRGGRRAVPGAGDDERCRPAGRGHARPLRGRHRLHPGAGRLRPDGQGHVVDGPRRPAPRAGGDRRGRHRGGDGRLRGPHQGLGCRRPRGGVGRRVPRRRPPLPVVLPVAQPGGPTGPGDVGPRRPAGRGAVPPRADRAAAAPTT